MVVRTAEDGLPSMAPTFVQEEGDEEEEKTTCDAIVSNLLRRHLRPAQHYDYVIISL
jgi:hypothetical protein